MSRLPDAMLRALNSHDLGVFDREVVPPPNAPPRPPSHLFPWNDDQRAAIEEVVAWRHGAGGRYLKLTGPGGTGKTAVTREIRRRLLGTTTAWSATTSRAALRLREATGAKTTTTHSAIYHPPREVDNAPEARVDLLFENVKHGDVEDMLLVVDECFDYHQKILTEFGWEEIGQIVSNKQQVRVLSRDPITGTLVPKRILRWLKNPAPTEGLLRIDVSRTGSLRSARVIRCTRSHKILTPTGYVEAGALRPGSEVLVRGFSYTKEQRSTIIGSLLGDGSVTRSEQRNSVQIKMMNGEAQVSYLEFKRAIFGDLASHVSKHPSGYPNGKPVYSFTIRVADEATSIVQEMPHLKETRDNGRRIWSPTDRFLEHIDEQALAIWFLDNGSVSTKPVVQGDPSHYATLHTQRFSKADNERFADYLKSRFGIEACVREDTYGYWYLGFRKEATSRLFDVIRPFTPACMSWKVSGGNYEVPQFVQPDTTVAKVREVKADPFDRKGRVRRFVYDIEVEDFHNYVAGNVVVSNCSMIGPRFRADIDKSPYAKVLFVGDPFQLSPVLSKAEESEIGGEDYSVFHGTPGPHLGIVMRNGGAVLAAATIVREQRRIPTESGISDGSRYDYVELWQPNDVVPAAVEGYLADPDGHVLIAWKNETRMLANAVIRHRLGRRPDLPEVGERLVVRRNSHKVGVLNGDVVEVESVGDAGPVLAGVPTRFFRVREESSGRSLEILAPVGDFSGTLPYVGLDVWKKALREAKVPDVVPLTYSYCLTAHLAQGSQYRRVSILSPGDFRSAHYNKMTRLPDGSEMPFSLRHLYTSISRAVKHASLYYAR